MRCMICNEIIEDDFRIISGQEEICEECFMIIYDSEDVDNDDECSELY